MCFAQNRNISVSQQDPCNKIQLNAMPFHSAHYGTALNISAPTCPKYSSCLSRTPCREETAPRQAEAKQPTMKSSWNSKCLSKSGWNQLGEHGEKICYTYTNILDLFVIIFLNLFVVVKLERLKRLLQVEAGWCQHHHLAKRFFLRVTKCFFWCQHHHLAKRFF